VTFTVPDGYALASLILTDYSSTDQRGFVALQSGSQWTAEPALGALPAPALADAHFGTGNAGNRPVCALSYAGSTATPSGSSACVSDAAANSDLFSRNILNTLLQSQPAGPYTFWIQQTAAAPVNFTFQAQFRSVSVPGPLPLLQCHLDRVLVFLSHLRAMGRLALSPAPGAGGAGEPAMASLGLEPRGVQLRFLFFFMARRPVLSFDKG
jgi:hypothetical protein